MGSVNLSWGRTIQNFKKNVSSTTKDTDEQIGKLVDRVGTRMYQNAKRFTPVETGNLRRNWRLKRSGKDDKRQVEVSNDTSYATYVENGTSRQAPKRMMAKAYMNGTKQLQRGLNRLKYRMKIKFNG